MKLIVGLGNPGAKYEKTRHNTGFRAVRAFHSLNALDFDGWKEKFTALVSEGKINGEKTILLLPQTYMNRSGQAVRLAADFWKIDSSDILIVTDDIDLPTGKIRIRPEGSAGGHNGLKDIFDKMGTNEIPRLRIGIANEFSEKIPAEKFVLESFGKEDENHMASALPRAVDCIKITVTEGVEEAMNRCN